MNSDYHPRRFRGLKLRKVPVKEACYNTKCIRVHTGDGHRTLMIYRIPRKR